MSTATEHVNGTEVSGTSHAESWARAGVSEAEAEAIRARTAAEIRERETLAAAEAEAIKIKAAEEAEKQRIANQRAAMRLEKEKADHAAKIAEANRREQAANRAAAEEREAAQAEKTEKASTEKAVDTATTRWRRTAMGFYGLCALVALPVQIAAFYRPDALYLVVAPFFVEVIALVALVGAAAAVTAGRPHWHYRLVAWAGAFTAAGINLWHGLAAFDTATAIGTAIASVAGPGMWDLHEHGRIVRRDGRKTWRQRRAERKGARKEARRLRDEQAAEEQRQAELAELREELFPEVWDHAVRLAAALGETTVTDAIWRRAHIDIEGTDPGEDVDTIRTRNAAQRRLVAARSEAPGETPQKITSSQRAIQMKSTRQRSSYRPVPPRRTAGDTAPYHPAARAAASESKRRANAAKNTAPSGS